MSILTTINNVDMIASFSLDYMHLACLGVMKRLLKRWNGSKAYQKKCHLNVNSKTNFNNKIKEMSHYIPSEFTRRMEGGLKGLMYWKAAEYRFFLLYGGCYILADENIINKKYYVHFLKFCIAMRILLTANQEQNLEFCKELLVSFVVESKKLYGEGFITYNVHSLIHLPDDYQKFGSLDNVSCFPFESFLGSHIKGCLKGHYKPLEQIVKHCSNTNACVEVIPSQDVVYGKKCRITANPQPFKSIKIGKTKLVRDTQCGRDNIIALHCNKIVIIEEIYKNNLIVREFKQNTPLFRNFVESSKIGIYKISHLSNTSFSISLDSVAQKVFVIPQKDYFVGMKLLHNL
jgi:hypothetical protein